MPDKKWRDNNKERISQYNKDYRARKKNDPEYKVRVAVANKKHRESAQYNPERFVNFLHGNAKQGAKNRDIKFALTKEDVRNLCIESNGKCALSGLPLSSMFNDPMKASIDRIDSNKGYTRDNVQLVGAIVNQAKMDLSVQLFVEMCKGVAKNGTV